jgi:hypothetical protein
LRQYGLLQIDGPHFDPAGIPAQARLPEIAVNIESAPARRVGRKTMRGRGKVIGKASM